MWEALDEELLPIPDGLLCPVCQGFFEDPVATVDGHSYCRGCITEWFERHDRRASERKRSGQHLDSHGAEVPFDLLAPMTQLALPSRALQGNVALRRAVAAYKEGRPGWERRERERRDLRERLDELERQSAHLLDEDHKTALVAELHRSRSRGAELERQLKSANSEILRLRADLRRMESASQIESAARGRSVGSSTPPPSGCVASAACAAIVAPLAASGGSANAPSQRPSLTGSAAAPAATPVHPRANTPDCRVQAVRDNTVNAGSTIHADDPSSAPRKPEIPSRGGSASPTTQTPTSRTPPTPTGPFSMPSASSSFRAQASFTPPRLRRPEESLPSGRAFSPQERSPMAGPAAVGSQAAGASAAPAQQPLHAPAFAMALPFASVSEPGGDLAREHGPTFARHTSASPIRRSSKTPPTTPPRTPNTPPLTPPVPGRLHALSPPMVDISGGLRHSALQASVLLPNAMRRSVTPPGVAFSQSPQRCHRRSMPARVESLGYASAGPMRPVADEQRHHSVVVQLPFAAGHMGGGAQTPVRRSVTPPALACHRDVSPHVPPMHMAVGNGCFESVRRLCTTGWDCDTVDATGMTPLHVACHKGHIEIARFLCSESAGVGKDLADSNGATPLHVCAANGHVEMVQLLCEAGVDTDLMDFGGATPLHVAAHMGHLAVVNCLLEAGCSASRCVANGLTALAAASRQGHHDVVRLLRKAEAWPRLAPRTTYVRAPIEA